MLNRDRVILKQRVLLTVLLFFSMLLLFFANRFVLRSFSVNAPDMPLLAKESPFLAFQIKQRNQNKEKKMTFLTFSSVCTFSIQFFLYSIKFASFAVAQGYVRQAVRGLMTEFSERFPSFHCLRCQTLM